MENIFISFLLIEILFTTILIINCAIDELLPIKEYKKWSQNKNWFGKIYIYIYYNYIYYSCSNYYIYRFFHCVLSNIYLYTWN